MSRKLISILTIVSFLVIPSISLAKDFIQIGNTKKEILEVLGAPTRVSKYEFLNKEVWGYGLSSITFKNGTVYEYTGGKGLKIKLVPFIGIVDRKKKKVYAKVSLPNKEGKKLSGNQILGILNQVCKKKSTIITDEFTGYNILRRTKHVHLVIDHTRGFVDDFVHTNNVESFWAILKREVYGIYHHVSVKYLQAYVNEFCFRFNNKDNEDMFDLMLSQAVLA